jgi:UTP--glucose-1-phosphate uridylyltransferase
MPAVEAKGAAGHGIRRAVVPAAGLGTRLLPATRAIPKELLPVGDRPVIQHVAEELAANGIEDVLLVTRRGKDAIVDHFDTGAAGLGFTAVRQAEPRGLGDAVLCAETWAAGRPFVVALGDAVLSAYGQSTIAGPRPASIVARLAQAFERADAVAAIAVEAVPREQASRYGMVGAAGPAPAPGEAFEVSALVEKPAPGQAPGELAVAARYVLSPAIFAALRETPPGAGGELQLTDAIARLAQARGRVVGVRLAADERRHDVGDLGSYLRAATEFALTHPEHGAGARARASELLDGDRPG